MTFKAEIVFVRILIPFIAGIYLAYLFENQDFIIPFLLLNVILLLYLLVVNISYKRIKAYNFKGITGLIFYCFSFSFGSLICLLNTQSYHKDYFANKTYDYLKVWVNGEPQLKNEILRFEVEIAAAYTNNTPRKATGKLLIALKVDSLYPIQLNYGNELLIKGDCLPVEPPYNPGEFNFKAWLASKNIFHQTFINQGHVIKLNTFQGNPIIKYAIEERKRQVAIYRNLIKNDEAFAVASTLVLGYRADLSKETLAAYSKTGTIHALSVSGAHVGIIFLLLNALLSFLDRKKAFKILKVFLICSLVWYYSILTGFSPSVLRSAIMLTVFILAKAYNKTSNNYNILAFTAFVLLVHDPFLIWDVGFQLSFLSVFGLIYLQPKIYKWLYVKNKWLDKLWSAIALSLAAQLATFPLSIYYFHQFPIYFILGNLFILLPLIAMMYFGIAILFKVYFLAPIFEWIIIFTNDGLKWISNLPFSRITSIWMNQWQLLLLSLSLSLLIYALVNFKKKLLLCSIALLTIFQSYSAYTKITALKQRKILFFSLRKNYAAAFIEGKNAILVTDLSLSDKNLQFFVQPGLDQMQVENIQLLRWENDTTTNSFIKKEHQLTFHHYHVLLVDKSFNYKKIDGLPRFDAVWLHQSPKKEISSLRTEVLFSTLLIDASNKDYSIRTYEEDVNKFQLDHYTLKKNKAYLINLN